MTDLPPNSRLLAEEWAEQCSSACRTSIWRARDGTFGAEIVEMQQTKFERVTTRVSTLQGAPTLGDLDRRLLFEATRLDDDGRPNHAVLQAAAAALAAAELEPS